MHNKFFSVFSNRDVHSFKYTLPPASRVGFRMGKTLLKVSAKVGASVLNELRRLQYEGGIRFSESTFFNCIDRWLNFPKMSCKNFNSMSMEPSALCSYVILERNINSVFMNKWHQSFYECIWISSNCILFIITNRKYSLIRKASFQTIYFQTRFSQNYVCHPQK